MTAVRRAKLGFRAGGHSFDRNNARFVPFVTGMRKRNPYNGGNHCPLGVIMGNSLHNRIYLGRRNVLFNVRRLRFVAGIALAALVLLSLRTIA